MNIIGIAACTSGIAHTYIAKEKLTKAGLALGHNVHIETQGTIGIEDELSAELMMDASSFPYEENVAITKKMVEFAEVYHASVEAEVGNIGAVTGDNYTNQEMYTDPKVAIDFAKRTGIDALAISYGSSHGDYPEGFTPAFQFDIVREIKSATNMPLVLHGGSGCGAENIRESVRLGINKINVGSDFMKAQVNQIKTNLKESPAVNYVDLIHETIKAGTKAVKYYIHLSGSTGKSL